jgi:hypothetical protein
MLWYSRIVSETVLAKELKKTPATVMSGYEEAKAPEEMETLLHRELAKYEARLTLEQREKLTVLRGIVEKLRSMYP